MDNQSQEHNDDDNVNISTDVDNTSESEMSLFSNKSDIIQLDGNLSLDMSLLLLWILCLPYLSSYQQEHLQLVFFKEDHSITGI